MSKGTSEERLAACPSWAVQLASALYDETIDETGADDPAFSWKALASMAEMLVKADAGLRAKLAEAEKDRDAAQQTAFGEALACTRLRDELAEAKQERDEARRFHRHYERQAQARAETIAAMVHEAAEEREKREKLLAAARVYATGHRANCVNHGKACSCGFLLLTAALAPFPESK